MGEYRDILPSKKSQEVTMRKISLTLTIILAVCLLIIQSVSAVWIYAGGNILDSTNEVGMSMPDWDLSYTVRFVNNSEDLVDPIEVPFGTAFVLSEHPDILTAAQEKIATQPGFEDYKVDYWMNAGSTMVTEISADNRNDIILYPSFLDIYIATFVDQNGNIVSQVTFTKGQKELDPSQIPPVPEIEGTGILNYTGSWEEYTLGNSDITIYPHYEITTDNLGFDLIPVDSASDGTTDYYVLEVVSNLGANITVPGSINGVPILIVKNLTSGSDAKDVVNIVISEGIEELTADAATGAAKLKTIALPRSLQRITGQSIFGKGQKQITITYSGTVEEFIQIQKTNGWDNGLGNGTTINCTDGVIECTGNARWRYNGQTININPNPYTS